MIKYGLKIWSTNKNWFEKAVALFKQGKIDFLELYIVPDSFELKELEVLKQIPTMIHSPHCGHNFNLFELDDSKIRLFKNQVIKTANFLNSQFIILHAGVGKSKAVFQKNIAKISDKRLIVENMPKIGFVGVDNPGGLLCFGYSLEHLQFIKQKCGFNICLDFAHATATTALEGSDNKDFIRSLLTELEPYYFHISGGKKDNPIDQHLNLYEGDFDVQWAKKILLHLAKEKALYLVFETPKIGKDLENDIKNINYFTSF